MVDVLLSKHIAEIIFLVLGGLTVLGSSVIISATSRLHGLCREFARWNPKATDPEGLAVYKSSVAHHFARSGNALSGMWLAFLDEVTCPGNREPRGAACSSAALERLRENLLFAHSASVRLAKHTGGIVAGLGLSVGLAILCAAAFQAAGYFGTTSTVVRPASGSWDRGLSILISGGGVALLVASGSLLASVLASAFERSQSSRAERSVDKLIAALRLQIAIINTTAPSASDSSSFSQLMPASIDSAVPTLERIAKIVTEGLDRIATLESRGQERSEATTQRLGESLLASGEQTRSMLLEHLKTLHAERARFEEAKINTKHAKESEKDPGRDANEEQHRVLTATLNQLVDLGRAQTQIWESVLNEIRQNTATTLAVGENSERELSAQIVKGFEEVIRKIEALDEGISLDVDDILNQSKKSQTALVHALLAQTEAVSLISSISNDPIAERHAATKDSERDSSSPKTSQRRAVVRKSSSARKPLARAPHRGKVTELDVKNILSMMQETAKSLLRAIDRSHKSPNPQDDLSSDCSELIHAINEIIHLLIAQTDARMESYGPAYEHLAESNTLICEILSTAIGDIGNFRRQGALATGAPPTELLADLQQRIARLEEFLPLSHQADRIKRPQMNSLEIMWSRASKAALNHKDWVVIAHSGRKQKVRASRLSNFQDHVTGLREKIATLRERIASSVLDQVASWPALLDQARHVREASKQLAAMGTRWTQSSPGAKEQSLSGVSQILQAVEVTEELVLLTETAKALDEETPRASGTARP